MEIMICILPARSNILHCVNRVLMTVLMSGIVTFGAAASEDKHDEYKLGPLDAVRIKAYEWRATRAEVFEWKPLNDQFTIGSEGNLSLPLIGEVKAAGYTTAELGP